MTLFDSDWMIKGIELGDLGCIPMAQHGLMVGHQLKHIECWLSRYVRPVSCVPLRFGNGQYRRYFAMTHMDELTLLSLSYGVDTHVFAPADDALYLVILLNGIGMKCPTGDVYSAKAEDVLVWKPGEALNAVFVQNAQHLVIRISSSEFLRAQAQGIFQRLASPACLADIKTLTKNLLGQLMVCPDHQSSRWHMSEWAKRMKLLLTSECSVAKQTQDFSSLPGHLQRFVDQLMALDANGSLNDLIAVMPVSSRKLYQDFQLFMNCSPYQFLKLHRLRRVRMSLLADESWNLSDLASIHGFAHLGRFSSYYQSVFGELPSASRKAFRQELNSFAGSMNARGVTECWMAQQWGQEPVRAMDMRCQHCIKQLIA